MLRNCVGEEKFRSSLELYLERYREKTAETDDLRKVFEEKSGMKLEQFFDQWIYRSGHPELEIEFSLTNEHKKLKIKIAQKQVPQDYNSFSFPLEIRIVYVDEEQSHTVQIVQKEQEETVEIVQDREIKYISIDPYFKVLRKIKTINVSEETDKFTIRGLLENQLKDGKTIIEKIDAARALRDRYSKDVIKSLQEKVLDDRFYGVSAQLQIHLAHTMTKRITIKPTLHTKL